MAAAPGISADKARSRAPGRAVVTGAAGFIGSHLTETLLDRGWNVLGIDSFTSYYSPATKRANLAEVARHSRFELLAGDLLQLELGEVLQSGDVVFHLAGQPGVRASWGDEFTVYSRNNIDATQRLLEAAHRCGIARLIFASSSSVYGDAPLPMAEDGPTLPISPYGLTKLAAEQLVLLYGRSFGLEVVPLRFFTVFGPRQRPDMAFSRFIEAIIAGRPVTVYGDGSQQRDFTYVDDVVEALLAAAEWGEPGQPVNVGGGSPVAVREAVAILEDLLARRASLEFRLPPVGDARDTLADYTRLQRLGVATRTDIAEGLRRQVDWRLRAAPPLRLRGAGLSRPREDRSTYVLYSHDTYGLGHMRRNAAIAHAITESEPESRVVMITGSPVAATWPLPRGIEIIQLPPLTKVGAESYRPIADRSLAGLLAERSGIICSSLARLRPHTFLVDHAPLGVKGELRMALEMVREQLPQTWTILGMRDILDEADVVRRLWAEQGTLDWISGCYDRVLVYGSRDLYDVGREYGFGPRLTSRMQYTGYVAKGPGLEPELRGASAWQGAPRDAELRILVTGGGGGDGAPLFSAFLEAWPRIQAEMPARALMVTGPLMGEDARLDIETRAGKAADLQLLRTSHGMLNVIAAADLVVSMGGYNSVVEAVAARKRLVLCPRIRPRQEQLIRAEIFASLGLARSVRLEDEGPSGLTHAVLAAMAGDTPRREAWSRLDLRGGERAAGEVMRPNAATLSRAV